MEEINRVASADMALYKAIEESIVALSKGSLKSDQMLLELITACLNRILKLETKVELLMELHRVDGVRPDALDGL
jgi:hypothetical protein